MASMSNDWIWFGFVILVVAFLLMADRVRGLSDLTKRLARDALEAPPARSRTGQPHGGGAK